MWVDRGAPLLEEATTEWTAGTHVPLTEETLAIEPAWDGSLWHIDFRVEPR